MAISFAEGQRRLAAQAGEQGGAAGAAPPSTPVAQPAAPAAPAPTPQQREARASALGLSQRHGQIRQRKAEKVKPWEEANPGKRSVYRPAPQEGEQGYVPWKLRQEQIQAMGDVVAGYGNNEALDQEFRKQWNYGATNALVQHLVDKGVGGFARVNMGTAEEPFYRGIHTSRGNDAPSAIEYAFKSRQLGGLGLSTPEAQLQRIAADSGIEYTDLNDLQQKVYAAVELGGGAGQVAHQNMTEMMARLASDLGPRVAAAGGDDAAFYGSVFGPAGVTQLPTAGVPRSKDQQKQGSSNAVSSDTAGIAAGEEQKNALMKWFGEEGVAGVNKGWLTAGGVGTAGLALAAYLASSGGQQQDPSSYRDQQISANSYGSY